MPSLVIGYAVIIVIASKQPTTNYRQTSKSLSGTSQPTRVKITINTIYSTCDSSSSVDSRVPVLGELAKFEGEIL